MGILVQNYNKLECRESSVLPSTMKMKSAFSSIWCSYVLFFSMQFSEIFIDSGQLNSVVREWSMLRVSIHYYNGPYWLFQKNIWKLLNITYNIYIYVYITTNQSLIKLNFLTVIDSQIVYVTFTSPELSTWKYEPIFSFFSVFSIEITALEISTKILLHRISKLT